MVLLDLKKGKKGSFIHKPRKGWKPFRDARIEKELETAP